MIPGIKRLNEDRKREEGCRGERLPGILDLDFILPD